MTISGRSQAIAGKFILVLITLILAACVAVPNVVGDTLTAASKAITAAGLTVGTVTYQSSTTVPAGNVISQSPVGLTVLAKPAPVSLVISSGPPTYSIGGTVIGLAPGATVNVINGADNAPIQANGSFVLPTGVASGGTYSVTVGTPTSSQSCAVQNGSGTIAAANVTNVLVYCTYNVSVATLNNTYTYVFAQFQPLANVDLVGQSTDDGMGNTANHNVTVNFQGTIAPNLQNTETYTVTTNNGIPVLNGSGGIEGVNGAAAVAASLVSGTPSGIGVSVLPNVNATTNSISGNYTLVNISAQLSTGNMYGYLATVALTNGTITGTYTQNVAGTVTTGNPASAQWSVTNGLLTSVGAAQGAVSADGDLLVLADTTSGDDPHINVAVPRGTGVTPATFEGVYSVAVYGGNSVNATFGQILTVFAYGNGTYTLTYSQNDNGTITTNHTDTGTYTVTADGTLTVTNSSGGVSNGAISADGNALVLANITSGQTPQMVVGVRQ
jgi:PASTA domain